MSKKPIDDTLVSKAIVHDRRSQGSSSTKSVERFKKQHDRQIRKRLQESFNNDSIADIANGQTIDIPVESGKEYVIHKDQGGTKDRVHPGNDQFSTGDLIQRPKGGGGGGGAGEGDASDSGEGQDDFVFQVSQEEYLDVLFEDLELPNLEMKEIAKAVKMRFKRKGITSSGTPERLIAERTVKKNKSRKIAVGLNRLKRIQNILELTLTYVNARNSGQTEKEAAVSKDEAFNTLALEMKADNKLALAAKKALSKSPSYALYKLCMQTVDTLLQQKRVTKAMLTQAEEDLNSLLAQLIAAVASKRRSSVTDADIDGVFGNIARVPEPSENAVMFCLMDVSGSMDQETKENAKRFYILLYLFLIRTYGKDNVDIVFIRHHTQAKECDEEEFFYSQETGGTIASSALELMNEIQEKRYPASEYNVFAAQASDGDNWGDDNRRCNELVREMLEERVRYFVYVEITRRQHQEMWRTYEKIASDTKQMAIGHITSKGDIPKVFREFFLKDDSKG